MLSHPTDHVACWVRTTGDFYDLEDPVTTDTKLTTDYGWGFCTNECAQEKDRITTTFWWMLKTMSNIIKWAQCSCKRIVNYHRAITSLKFGWFTYIIITQQVKYLHIFLNKSRMKTRKSMNGIAQLVGLMTTALTNSILIGLCWFTNICKVYEISKWRYLFPRPVLTR